MVGAYTIVLIGRPAVAGQADRDHGESAIAFALAMERVAFRPLRGASPATLLIALLRR